MRGIKKSTMKVMAVLLVLAVAFAYSPVAAKYSTAKTKKQQDPIEVSNAKDFGKMKIDSKNRIKLNMKGVKGTPIYSSDNENICTVNKNGLVKAQKFGTAIITIKIKNKESIKTSLKVTVVKPKVKSVKFQSKEFYYDFTVDDPDEPDGEATDPEEENDPEDNEPDNPGDDDEFIEWNDTDDTADENMYRLVSEPDDVPVRFYSKYYKFESSDPTVGEIDAKGKIKVLKHGETTITVTLKSNKKQTASIKIIVREPVDEGDDEDDETTEE